MRWALVCTDLHVGLGLFDTEQEAVEYALGLNSYSMLARASGTEACLYAVVEMMSLAEVEGKQVEYTGGQYL